MVAESPNIDLQSNNVEGVLSGFEKSVSRLDRDRAVVVTLVLPSIKSCWSSRERYSPFLARHGSDDLQLYTDMLLPRASTVFAETMRMRQGAPVTAIPLFSLPNCQYPAIGCPFIVFCQSSPEDNTVRVKILT